MEIFEVTETQERGVIEIRIISLARCKICLSLFIKPVFSTLRYSDKVDLLINPTST